MGRPIPTRGCRSRETNIFPGISVSITTASERMTVSLLQAEAEVYLLYNNVKQGPTTHLTFVKWRRNLHMIQWREPECSLSSTEVNKTENLSIT